MHTLLCHKDLTVCIHKYVCGFVATYVAICDLLCRNPPLTHIMSKKSFHCQWIALSINQLIASTTLPNVDIGLLLLRLVSEACQT